MSADATLTARYNGSDPIAGDTILSVLPDAPMMSTHNVNLPQGMFTIVIFTGLPTGLVNGAIIKFYGFPEHARTCVNIITAPEYILVKITEALETMCNGAIACRLR